MIRDHLIKSTLKHLPSKTVGYTYYRKKVKKKDILKCKLNVMFSDSEVHINCNYMKMYYSSNLYKMQLGEYMSAFVTHLNRN